MKLNNILTFLILIIFLFLSCKKNNSDILFDFGETPSPYFEEDELFFTKQIILNAAVVRNELVMISANNYSNITADGEVELSSPSHSTSLSYFIKHCIGKNFMALSFANNYPKGIQFYSTNENAFFDTDTRLYTQNIGYIDSLTPLKYKKFNYGLDNTAINEYNKTLLPVIKNADTSAISFILFDLKEYIDSLPYSSDYTLSVNKYIEINLPTESTNNINRIESFHQNFYVSTEENTYLIRPDGNYKLITEGSASDFFQYDNKTFADFGNRILSSTDKGETWEEKNNTPVFDGFREFSEIYGRLIFYHKDELFLINSNNFSFTSLNSKGLEGSKITAVLPFHKQVYITTLSGIFSKPIEYLEL